MRCRWLVQYNDAMVAIGRFKDDGLAGIILSLSGLSKKRWLLLPLLRVIAFFSDRHLNKQVSTLLFGLFLTQEKFFLTVSEWIEKDGLSKLLYCCLGVVKAWIKLIYGSKYVWFLVCPVAAATFRNLNNVILIMKWWDCFPSSGRGGKQGMNGMCVFKGVCG